MPPVIAQILPAMTSGGVERGTLEIAHALTQKKWPNIVISHGGKLVAQLQAMGVKHITLPVHSKNPLLLPLTAWRLRQVLKREHVGLVHVRSRMPAWILRAALIGNRSILWLATFHGTYGLKPRWFKHFYNRILLKGQKIIAVSQHIKNHLLQNYVVDENFIRVIPRGVDMTPFDPQKLNEDKRQKMAQAWGINMSNPVLLLPGRRTRIKGHHCVIEALRQLKAPQVQCIFVGDDQGNTAYTQELKTAIDKAGLSAQIHLVDFCDDMPTAYSLADIVISATTKPESFGRTVIEAQAMGTLVVAARHGGTIETIDNGKTGFHFRPNDPDDLARVLKHVLALSPQQKQTIIANAQRHVTEKYTTAQMCQKTLSLYREILKGD